MTAKAKAVINRFHAERFALRDKVAGRLATLTPKERLTVLVSAGVLTKGGKLTTIYRQKTMAT